MAYVDGFLLPVKKSGLKDYKKMAKWAGKIWMEHGALEYKECVADDVNVKFGLPFPKTMKLKKGEIAVFSYIVYKSRAHRDGVNKKVMSDKRMKPPKDKKAMPFDMKRMNYGGFKVLVDA